jgi:hypothetical protein
MNGAVEQINQLIDLFDKNQPVAAGRSSGDIDNGSSHMTKRTIEYHC